MSWRQRAQKLRAVPLVSVLQLCGAQPDPYDPRKWHTSKGVLTVTGAKFMNWNCGRGGGGAGGGDGVGRSRQNFFSAKILF